MNLRKRTLLASAAVAAVGIGTLGTMGMASAATPAEDGGSSSIIDKLVSKFSLNKEEVQAVFDEARTERETEMKANQAERRAQAITDGKLTQEQADYITKAVAEIDALRGDSSPEDKDDTVHDQVKAKMDALRTWAEDNDVDMQYVMGGHGGGPGGRGGPRPDDTSSLN